MRSIGVIPARIGSTRLPSKPLIKILDKCLLQWVIEAVKGKTKLDEIVVATDDNRIVDLANSCGMGAVMTDPNLTSGTDRVFAAAQNMGADLVFNIQGDEPLVRPEWINSLIDSFAKDPHLKMGTVATHLPDNELSQLASVKVITDKNQNAIYFSRLGIPYTRMTAQEKPGIPMKHIGLYAFRKDFLTQFCAHPPSDLERCESLEQLRAMYMGERIRVLKVDGDSIGIDTPEDVAKLEIILKQRS